MSSPVQPRPGNPQRGRQQQRPQRYRRTSAIINERPDGKPIIFGYGRHMTRREKERVQRMLAYGALGVVVAISVIVVISAAIWTNFVYPNQSVASVNGHDISRHDRGVMTKYYQARAAQAAAQGGQLQGDPQTLAVQQLETNLLQRVSAQQLLGLTVSDAEAKAELARVVGKNTSSFERALAQYNIGKDDYLQLIEKPQVLTQKVGVYLTRSYPKVAEQWHYARIQVKDQKSGDAVLQQLLKPNQSFDAIARKLSLDSQTKSTGGDLGWERATDITDPLLATSFLKPLQAMQRAHATYQLVQDPLSRSWYVLEFLGHAARRALSTAQVQQDQGQAFRAWYQPIKARAHADPPFPAQQAGTGIAGGSSTQQSTTSSGSTK